MPEIEAVYGPEPRRDGESPDGARVGYNGVDKIVAVEQNLGSYGILWFHVYCGDQLMQSFNAAHVALVTYHTGE